jgi:hypothetical protein
MKACYRGVWSRDFRINWRSGKTKPARCADSYLCHKIEPGTACQKYLSAERDINLNQWETAPPSETLRSPAADRASPLRPSHRRVCLPLKPPRTWMGISKVLVCTSTSGAHPLEPPSPSKVENTLKCIGIHGYATNTPSMRRFAARFRGLRIAQ